jgi:hypothetical protein
MAKRMIEHPCLPKWRKIIDAAEKRGEFSGFECRLAGNFKSCATGEAYQRYPEIVRIEGKSGDSDFTYAPLDRKLDQLSHDFNNAVGADDFGFAHRVIDRIEKRLGELAHAR